MDMGQAKGRPISLGTQLEKSLTGIKGLDEVTKGGLPKGRPTLVCGGAGSGKTLLAAEFLVRGALQFGEPGVFMSFEETSDELTKNVASLGFKLGDLVAQKKISLDYVHIDRSEVEDTGEQGEKTFTRHGLEEYVSDCVIFLDHRISEQVSTRRIRVVKYRGSAHDTNEFPFLIDERGVTVMPITSLGLRHTVSNKRVSTGIPRLDAMLGGKGYYRGSSVLISGAAGTGKTSLAAHFAPAGAAAGASCLG